MSRSSNGSTLLAALFGVLLASSSLAQEAFKPEEITVQPGVGAGPHLFLAGSNRVHIIDPGTLKYQGQISTGGSGQLTLSEKGDTVFIASIYFSRGWTGVREDVVQIYDSTTLQQTGEVQVPKKLAMSGGRKPLMALSADNRWLFVQNATPATSVTVVDIKSRKTSAEIPTPGCWGIFPAEVNALRFVTVCGDGRFASHTLDARGRKSTVEVSEPVFDPDADPLFIEADRKDDDLLFVSFGGQVYRVSIAENVPKSVERFSIVEGIEGDWRPGGFQLLSAVPGSNVLYVLMHKKATDGSHTNAANEVWAIDMAGKAVLSRSTMRPATGIAVGGKDALALYAWEKDAKSVVRYAINASAGYTVREDSEIKIEEGSPRMEVR